MKLSVSIFSITKHICLWVVIISADDGPICCLSLQKLSKWFTINGWCPCSPLVCVAWYFLFLLICLCSLLSSLLVKISLLGNIYCRPCWWIKEPSSWYSLRPPGIPSFVAKLLKLEFDIDIIQTLIFYGFDYSILVWVDLLAMKPKSFCMRFPCLWYWVLSGFGKVWIFKNGSLLIYQNSVSHFHLILLKK